MKDLGIQSIWESHCDKKYGEKDCQQENICMKKSGKVGSKILTGVPPYNLDINILGGRKAK